MIRAAFSALVGVLLLTTTLGLAFGGFFLIPAAAQGTENACSAAALYAAKKANEAGEGPGDSPIAMGAVRLLGGQVVEHEMETRYPGIPTSASCAWVYWQAVMQPTPIVVRSTR